jgi:aspartate-semialdehyde dehydrogenase
LRFRVAVLGATGLVDQRFVSLLARHPWFELVALVASGRSAGQRFRDAVRWVIEQPLPDDVADIKVEPLDVNVISLYKPDILFSALPSELYEVEVELARRGYVVVSNSSPMRLDADIPLLNPEVNADHVDVVEVQRALRGWRGFIVKVPNCTTVILTLSLKSIHDEFGVRRVIVSTMQAISGAGLTGLPAMVIQDNIIPYIEGEEEKVERETLKNPRRAYR